MSESLDDRLHEKIKILCARGEQFAEREQYDKAIAEYEAARQLLPPPREKWEAATWILAALGDAHFKKGDFARAAQTFGESMTTPDAIGNPFLHLRAAGHERDMAQRASRRKRR